MMEDNQIKCKNIVSMYTIRMYINGFIIGYVFRHEIYKKFFLHKNDNLLFHYIKKWFYTKTHSKNSNNTILLYSQNLCHHRKICSTNKLNYYSNCKNNKFAYKLFPFPNLSNLKKNIQISNFLASRLALWTCFCTLTCWELNTVFESNIISPIFSGLVASSFNKIIFREYQKVLIPSWLGCVLSYIIFI
ncbi:hypothetical protein, conserved [Plasmodium gonderi]|uniref:Uncharacterized protein n=1 Tax=Plasmodium gonderi TaxID=77519 RepID=A0A1Y1JJG0_PLAGO|nr:hypothetical protein, conserved [Plasmodium gonderi]GAW82639.1 hypothetical protein, conserved [Plasmodium gonderi]